MQGVADEATMEKMLTSLEAASSAGCFVQGAGSYFDSSIDCV